MDILNAFVIYLFTLTLVYSAPTELCGFPPSAVIDSNPSYVEPCKKALQGSPLKNICDRIQNESDCYFPEENKKGFPIDDLAMSLYDENSNNTELKLDENCRYMVDKSLLTVGDKCSTDICGGDAFYVCDLFVAMDKVLRKYFELEVGKDVQRLDIFIHPGTYSFLFPYPLKGNLHTATQLLPCLDTSTGGEDTVCKMIGEVAVEIVKKGKSFSKYQDNPLQYMRTVHAEWDPCENISSLAEANLPEGVKSLKDTTLCKTTCGNDSINICKILFLGLQSLVEESNIGSLSGPATVLDPANVKDTDNEAKGPEDVDEDIKPDDKDTGEAVEPENPKEPVKDLETIIAGKNTPKADDNTELGTPGKTSETTKKPDLSNTESDKSKLGAGQEETKTKQELEVKDKDSPVGTLTDSEFDNQGTVPNSADLGGAGGVVPVKTEKIPGEEPDKADKPLDTVNTEGTNKENKDEEFKTAENKDTTETDKNEENEEKKTDNEGNTDLDNPDLDNPDLDLDSKLTEDNEPLETETDGKGSELASSTLNYTSSIASTASTESWSKEEDNVAANTNEGLGVDTVGDSPVKPAETSDGQDFTIDETVNKPKTVYKQSESISGESYEDEEVEGGHFMAYFLVFIVVCVAGYIVFHNKQKIIALVVEGKGPNGGGRRPSSKEYKRLKTEDVMPSLEKSAYSKNYVF